MHLCLRLDASDASSLTEAESLSICLRSSVWPNSLTLTLTQDAQNFWVSRCGFLSLGETMMDIERI
jgi:hypothetical protein